MDAYEWIDHLKLSMTRSLGLNTSKRLDRERTTHGEVTC